MNVISIVGRLAGEPEAKGKGTVFKVASSSGYGDKKVTMFYRCYAFGPQGEFVTKNFKKGSPISVSGDFQGKLGESGGKSYLNLDVKVSSVGFVPGPAKEEPAPKAAPLPVAAQQYADDDIPF